MEDMETMIEMGYEENDPALIPEIQEMLDEFQKDFDNIRIKTLLSGEYDSFRHGIRRASSLREGAFFAKRETLRLCQCLPLRGRWQRAALTEGVIP